MRRGDLPSIPMSEGGWVLLGEQPGREIALGLVGKFDESGFGKTVYDLELRELDPHRTLLSGLMRTATTDEHAQRWFRRYWAFGVGSGAQHPGRRAA